jgi:hypothetical protein
VIINGLRVRAAAGDPSTRLRAGAR